MKRTLLFCSLLSMVCWGCLLGGCTGANGQFDPRDTISILKDGKARGHLTVSTGGSLLSAGMKQTFFLGPENTVVAFDGDIDFSGTASWPTE